MTKRWRCFPGVRMGPRWFVIILKPSKADQAKRGIEEQGFEAFNPMCATQRGAAPLFGGYMFVRFDLTDKPNDCGKRWQGIANTRGVLRFLGAPNAVPAGAVEDLLRRAAAGGGLVQLEDGIAPDTFRKNEKVRFVEGPFLGFEGLVQADEGARVRVFLDMMGTRCAIPVTRESIARG